jgi:diketogulonate reductase-like aldo/keto reductase
MVEIETPDKIHRAIEKKLASGVSYIDALISYANEKNIEIETIGDIVKKSSVIKEKIRDEANSMKLLKEPNDNRTKLFE